MGDSMGTLTPRVVVVVDPGRSYGPVFGHSRPLCHLSGVSWARVAPHGSALRSSLRREVWCAYAHLAGLAE